MIALFVRNSLIFKAHLVTISHFLLEILLQRHTLENIILNNYKICSIQILYKTRYSLIIIISNHLFLLITFFFLMVFPLNFPFLLFFLHKNIITFSEIQAYPQESFFGPQYLTILYLAYQICLLTKIFYLLAEQSPISLNWNAQALPKVHQKLTHSSNSKNTQANATQSWTRFSQANLRFSYIRRQSSGSKCFSQNFDDSLLLLYLEKPSKLKIISVNDFINWSKIQIIEQIYIFHILISDFLLIINHNIIMKLTKYQKEALGGKEQILPNYIYNKKMLNIYKKVSSQNLGLRQSGQSFPEFLQMQNNVPNQQGTGRVKFSSKRRIQFIIIADKTPFNKNEKKILKDSLRKYLRFPVIENNNLDLAILKGEVIDKREGTQFIIKKKQKRFDAYSLLDILIEFQNENTILLALIQAQIHENGDLIDGRATGDGVGVISYTKKQLKNNFSTIIQTILHQTLHTLGFDHCIAWKCMMNAITNFTIWLCPACSRKIYHQLGISSQQAVQQWIRQNIQQLKKLKDAQNSQFGLRILQAITI